MNSRLQSLKRGNRMVGRKLDDTEIGAILEAFSESREAKARVTNQTITFRILLACSSVYVSAFLIIYTFYEINLVQPLEAGLINEDFLTIAFKIMCLIAVIVMLNATVDNLVLFTGLVSFEERPYLTLFIISRPLFLVAIVWMGIVYNSALADD